MLQLIKSTCHLGLAGCLMILAGCSNISPMAVRLPQDVAGETSYFPMPDVHAMSVDPRTGQIYFTTNEGIVRYSPESNSYQTGAALGFNLNLNSIHVVNAKADQAGNLYILSDEGVYFSQDGENFVFWNTGLNNQMFSVMRNNIVVSDSSSMIYLGDIKGTTCSFIGNDNMGPLIGAIGNSKVLVFENESHFFYWPLGSKSYMESDIDADHVFTGGIAIGNSSNQFQTLEYNPKLNKSRLCRVTQNNGDNTTSCGNDTLPGYLNILYRINGNFYAFGPDTGVAIIKTSTSTSWTTQNFPAMPKNVTFLGVGPDNKIWVAGTQSDLGNFAKLNIIHPFYLQAPYPQSAYQILVSPNQEDLLVAAKNGLWSSQNKGIDFNPLFNEPFFGLVGTAKQAFAWTSTGDIFKVNAGMIQQVGLFHSNFEMLLNLNDMLYAAGKDGLYVASLSKSFPIFQQIYNSAVTAMTLFQNQLYFSTHDALYLLNANNQPILINQEPFTIQRFHVFDNQLYAGTNQGIFVLNPNGSFRLISGTAGISTHDFWLTNNNLYIVDDSQKSVVEMPRSNTQNAIPLTVFSSHKIYSLFGVEDNIYVASTEGVVKIMEHPQ